MKFERKQVLAYVLCGGGSWWRWRELEVVLSPTVAPTTQLHVLVVSRGRVGYVWVRLGGLQSAGRAGSVGQCGLRFAPLLFRRTVCR